MEGQTGRDRQLVSSRGTESPRTHKSLDGTSVNYPQPSGRAGCRVCSIPLSHMGACPVLSLAGGFITQVSVLMKICSAAKKHPGHLCCVRQWWLCGGSHLPLCSPLPAALLQAQQPACLQDLSPRDLGADVVCKPAKAPFRQKVSGCLLCM